MMIKIDKKDFPKLIKFLQKEYDVFAPVQDGKSTNFGKIESVDDILLSSSNTKKSPKEIFFPQAEILFQYTDEGLKIPEKEGKPYAIWGARYCDVKAFQLLDKVFGQAHQQPDNKMYQDPYWKEKYDNTIVFGMACNLPDSTCFCNWFGGGPFETKGSDIHTVDAGEFFLLEAVSKKGEKLLKKYNGTKANSKEKNIIFKLKKKAEDYLSEKTDISNIFDKLNEVWDEPIWDELARKCINCGACAFVCPTCHCFDVSDEGKNKKGNRIRLWDSCMFSLFTKEASGHNPRDLSVQRVRQRVMHKYNYFMDNYDEHLCTGCGRCVTICPTNVDIREIIKEILDYRLTENEED